MKKTFIHIGYPKTASTFLQYNVFEKLHQDGLVHFTWWKRQPKGFLQKLLNIPFWYFPFDEMKETLSSANTPISLLSEEALSGGIFYKTINAKDVADKLKKLFPDGRILIIVRAQSELIVSLYKQLIHQGGAMSFEEFIGWKNGTINHSYSLSDNKLLWESLKYSHLIKYYIELFGVDNVKVLNFELLKREPNTFLAEILDFLELDKTINLSFTKGRTRGYGYYQILIARIFNPFLHSQFNRLGLLTLFPSVFNSQRVRTLLQSNILHKFLKKPFKISNEMKEVIKKYYEEDNKILVEELGIIKHDFIPNYLENEVV